jgi:hypothetical protein
VRVIVDQLFFPPAIVINQVLINVNKRNIAFATISAQLSVEGFSVAGTFFPGGQEWVREVFFPAQGFRSTEVAGGDHVEDVDVVALFTQECDIGSIAISSVTENFTYGPAGLLVFVLNVNTDIHLAKDKNQVTIRQGFPNFSYSLVMPWKIECGFAIQFIMAEQDCGVGYLGMIFKAAQGMGVAYGKDASMHGNRITG